jgi:hypothetical protein
MTMDHELFIYIYIDIRLYYIFFYYVLLKKSVTIVLLKQLTHLIAHMELW